MSSDLHTRLERLGDRARPAPDAFERLTRTRRRRERTRRITAGAVALLLTIGGTLVAFNAIDTGGGRTLSGTRDGFFALWPEQTSEGLAAAQERVEDGGPDVAWRAGEPIEIARGFASEVLLWPEVDISTDAVSYSQDDDVVSLELRVPTGAACDELVPAACPTGPTTVTMRRLGGDGLWSITDVHGEDLRLPLGVGEEVASGTTLTVPTNLPDGEKVSMGVAFLTACATRGINENVEAEAGQLVFQVPTVPDGCTGYVYAMRPKTGVGAVAIGSFLFTDAEVVPAIGYLVEEVSAVPVRFVDDIPVAVAEFTCDDTGTITPVRAVVAARSDGVHVALTNPGEIPVEFSIGLSGEMRGDGVQPGERNEVVWPIPPGSTTVSCSVEAPGFGGVASSATLTVEDPDGLFVPADLECPGSEAYGQAPGYVEGATGFAGDPVQVVRDHVSGLEYDDAVERALYPEDAEPVIRVIRDGVVAGKVTLFDDGAGGWLLSSLEGCSGTLFGWSEQPTGVSGAMGSSGSGVSGETGSIGSEFLTLCEPEFATEDAVNIDDGPDLHVDGSDLRFDTACLRAPAGEELTILFSNLDIGVERNISVYAMTPCLEEAVTAAATPACPSETFDLPIMSGGLVTGVDEIVYRLGPLEVGTYYFQDDVHPQTNGVLLVV